jgi:hypothetical protein
MMLKKDTPQEMIDEALAFTKQLIDRKHFADERELYQIVYYHDIFVNKIKDEVDAFDQLCLMYRDLCMFYKVAKIDFL